MMAIPAKNATHGARVSSAAESRDGVVAGDGGRRSRERVKQRCSSRRSSSRRRRRSWVGEGAGKGDHARM